MTDTTGMSADKAGEVQRLDNIIEALLGEREDLIDPFLENIRELLTEVAAKYPEYAATPKFMFVSALFNTLDHVHGNYSETVYEWGELMEAQPTGTTEPTKQ